MPASSTNPGSRMIEPAAKVTDNIIHVKHPTEPKLFKLVRGASLAKTLLKLGYVEITQEEYEGGGSCR